jgi:hypothetical protein
MVDVKESSPRWQVAKTGIADLGCGLPNGGVAISYMLNQSPS